jgi:uncharacterized protein YjbI with pentapeptide repeats
MAYLIGAELTNANAFQSNLTSADLSQANLTNTTFDGAKLTDADFTGARYEERNSAKTPRSVERESLLGSSTPLLATRPAI